MISVLFVCSGNICRSPLAQGIFEDLVRREGLDGGIQVDSAGTHAFYHEDEPPDQRAQESAAARGLNISGQRSRMVGPDDCLNFDYVLVADEGHLRALRGLCGGEPEKVRLLLDYAPDLPEREIPDPYFGGPDGFEYAMDLIEAAAEGLFTDIRERYLSRRA